MYVKKILLTTVVIIITLIFSEILIRYYFPPVIDGPMFATSKQGYTLNRDSGIVTYKKDNIKVDYSYYPQHLRDTPYHSKSTHILMLGDSFTFGWLLPWPNTYIYQLQKFTDNEFGINKYQYLNAATGGWGTADYLAYLEEYGAQLSPKFVIVFLNTDDIGRSMKSHLYQLKNSNSLQLRKNLHTETNSYLHSFFPYQWLLRHSDLLKFIRERMVMMLHPAKSNTAILPMSADMVFQDQDAIRYGQALFLRINKWCKKNHAKLIVITTGFNAFYPTNIHDPTRIFLLEAPSFFNEENIPYFDMGISYKNRVNGSNFQIANDHHPNAYGAKVIAELSWPWIKTQLQPKH